MLPGKEVESESGEYEPVTNENEMDVFSNGSESHSFIHSFISAVLLL